MLEDHIAAGFDPAAFPGLTPRLYAIGMRGARRRLQGDLERQVAAAYIGATIGRAVKIPPLESVLKKLRPRERMSPAQMLQNARAWDAQISKEAENG